MLRRINVFLLIFAALGVSLLFSGFNKPLWIDEYLHFAFGGLSFFEAIDVVESSTGSGVNWGQTGTYFLMDNILLNFFGANLHALRLPSIISGFVLIGAAIYFLRLKGQNPFFQWLVVFAFLAQGSLMYFTGESRPYMPMASSAVAALAFYAIPMLKRSTFIGYFLAFWRFIWGALMHPYWPGFLVMIIAFSIWVQRQGGDQPLDRRLALRFIAFPWLIAGGVIYLTVAALTWAKGTAGFVAPPFEWMGSATGTLQTLVSTHLMPLFLPSAWDIPYLPIHIQWFNISRLLIVVTVITISLLAIISRKKYSNIKFAAVLIWIGISSSFFLALLSYVQSYWILQRQWVGGMAITTVGIIWALGIIMRNLKSIGLPRFPVLVASAAVATIAFNSANALIDVAQSISQSSDAWSTYDADSRSREDLVAVTRQSGDWVYLGNMNIVRGGPVWREVSDIYGSR